MSKIAVISDTHDQIANLRSVINFCNEYSISSIIHCGDLISPFMLDELEMFNGTTHLIYGNNLGDQHLIAARCSPPSGKIIHHGFFGSVVLDNLKIAIIHDPDQARALAQSSLYDIVCFGHNHIYEVSRLANTTLVNPGHLLGKDGPGSFVILDTRTREIKRYRAGQDMNTISVEISE